METYDYSILISQISEIETYEFESFRKVAIGFIRTKPGYVRERMERTIIRLNFFKKIISETDLFYNDDQSVRDQFINQIESHFRYIQKVENTLNGVPN